MEKKVKFIMLNLDWDVSSFENCVDPDQLASQKLGDQDLHCNYTHSAYKCMLNWILAIG